MTKRLHTVALLTAAGALLAVPAIGQADKPNGGGHQNHGKRAKSCTAQPNVNKGFVVKGTLFSYTPGAQGAQPSVTITVTGANRHARISEEYTDADLASGTTRYTADAGSGAFKLQLSGYEGTDTPSVGDKVRVIGKVPVRRKKCLTNPTTSLADRYGTENIRKVKIIDVDPDPVPVTPVTPRP